jgi:adenylosuccinate synthase
VVGCHWGDEGKGKLIDYLASQADMVIRYNGGANAGHSIVNEYGSFALHLVPSGIFYPGVACLLGPGTAVDPGALLAELSELARHGVDISGLRVADRAHVVMPYHKRLDALEEAARGTRVQGTTRRGIGPCYTDKAARLGVRIGDLLDEAFLQQDLPYLVEQKNRVLTRLYDDQELSVSAVCDTCRAWGEALRPMVVDSLTMVQAALHADQSVILEGQLGVLRDIDWGMYPYVTSSSALAGGAAAGAGIPARAIANVIGVLKAYTTAVGEGPMPTELHNALGEQLREAGNEYGAATKRPRRCGWFDAVAARFSAEVNGCTVLALLKIDVLDTFPTLRLCTGYRLDGRPIGHMVSTRDLARVEPIEEEWPGWETSTTGARTFADLPEAARRYITRIEELVGVPIGYIGVGPDRDALIIRPT